VADTTDPTHLNLAIVRGCLSSDPVSRELPSGDTLWSYEISVRRPEQPTDTVPVVLVGGRPPARLAAGDHVVAIGRVRRRFFRVGGATASRTEVVADHLVATRSRARAEAAVAKALRQVEAALERG
jgi:single-strand DNA-binding protein